METLVVLIAIFLSFSLLAETVGIWARLLGAVNNEPTTGYSTHVRIATLGRFFILLSSPSLGYLVDAGVSNDSLALIGIICFSNVLLICILFIKSEKLVFNKFYKIINRKSSVKPVVISTHDMKYDISFMVFVFVSFSLTGTGVILVNYLATLLPENRAMIVQMSAVITMIGTLVHIFLVDPKLSSAADTDIDKLKNYVLVFLVSRGLASLILVFMFSILYWI